MNFGPIKSPKTRLVAVRVSIEELSITVYGVKSGHGTLDSEMQ